MEQCCHVCVCSRKTASISRFGQGGEVACFEGDVEDMETLRRKERRHLKPIKLAAGGV
jgi:hypothetical protein